jgi:hypothetical protein
LRKKEEVKELGMKFLEKVLEFRPCQQIVVRDMLHSFGHREIMYERRIQRRALELKSEGKGSMEWKGEMVQPDN